MVERKHCVVSTSSTMVGVQCSIKYITLTDQISQTILCSFQILSLIYSLPSPPFLMIPVILNLHLFPPLLMIHSHHLLFLISPQFFPFNYSFPSLPTTLIHWSSLTTHPPLILHSLLSSSSSPATLAMAPLTPPTLPQTISILIPAVTHPPTSTPSAPAVNTTSVMCSCMPSQSS